MAKGMGNGFPIGAVMIASHIKPMMGMLGTTFGGNHLACAAALAVLEIMEEEKLIENATAMGNYIMTELKKISPLKNVRGKGLMIGFDVPETHAMLKKNLLHKHSIFTGEAKPNVIRLLPALTLKKEEADLFLAAIQEELIG
jgi:acetylornithine aminotransferase